MPKILDLREIDGEVWCRIGKPGEFESGIALWTPVEQEQNYQAGYDDGYDIATELSRE